MSRAATRIAAIQSSYCMCTMPEGSVPCPGRRRIVTSNPRASSTSPTFCIEYGESDRPWMRSAAPRTCGGVRRLLRL